MSEERTYSEQIKKLKEEMFELRLSNSKLSHTVGQKQREIEELRGQMREMKASATATAILDAQSTSISPAATGPSSCGSVVMIDKEGLQQQQLAALEETVGVLKVSDAKLLVKMTQMQKTIDEQRVSIEKLIRRISNIETLQNGSAKHIKALSKDVYEAAIDGNAQKLHQLVAEGANLDYKCYDDSTALHLVAGLGHVHALKVLIELGASLEMEAPNNNTALQYAVYNMHEDCVKVLLSAGANVNTKNIDGSTPLHFAAEKNLQSIVEILIAAGADQGMKNKWGETPIDKMKSDNLCALL